MRVLRSVSSAVALLFVITSALFAQAGAIALGVDPVGTRTLWREQAFGLVEP